MNPAYNVILFFIGLSALFLGGEGLVKGASRLAKNLGINPIVIGLTIVAFGTSSPEFLVSLIAALKGSSDLVIGNIVGSNIANIGLILGVSAIICSIRIQMKLLLIEIPIMIIFSLTLSVMALYATIGRLEGCLLFISLLIFVMYSYYKAIREPKQIKVEFAESVENDYKTWKCSLFIIVGLIGLLVGARLTVNSAIFIAHALGISEAVIGISAVAVGTSLPELSTSIVAAIRKEQDIVVGNIIGSNIFNVGILGLVSIIKPIHVDPKLIKFEFPVMLLFTIATVPIMKTGFRVSRFEGILLLIFYIIFIFMLFKWK